jgi:ankyrin repeat protein
MNILPTIYLALKSGKKEEALLNHRFFISSYLLHHEEYDTTTHKIKKVSLELDQIYKDEFIHDISGKIYDNDIEYIRDLIMERGLINLLDEFGKSPLHNLISNSILEEFYGIIELGADVNIIDSNGNTPLQLVDLSKNREFAKKLINLGADPLYSSHTKHSIFTESIINTDLDLFNFILSKTSKKDLKEKLGWTDLHIAIALEDKELFDSEIVKTENIEFLDKDGISPGYLAIFLGKTHYFKKLVDNGLYLTTTNKYLGSYLHASCKSNNIQCAKYFLEKFKASPEILNAMGNEKIMHLAARYSSPEMIDLLYSNGFDVNTKSYIKAYEGRDMPSETVSTLYCALFNKNPHVLQKLLSLGADPTCAKITNISIPDYDDQDSKITTEKNSSIASEAIFNNKPEALQIIKDQGIKISIDDIPALTFIFDEKFDFLEFSKILSSLIDYINKEEPNFTIGNLDSQFNIFAKHNEIIFEKLINIYSENSRMDIVYNLLDVFLSNYFFSANDYGYYQCDQKSILKIGNEDILNHLVNKLFKSDSVEYCKKIYFIHFLCENNRLDVLEKIIDEVTDEETKLTLINDSLVAAVIANSIDCVNGLISKGAIINKSLDLGDYKYMPFYQDDIPNKYSFFKNTFNGDLSAPKLIRNANILHVAALFSNQEMINFILSQDVDFSVICTIEDHSLNIYDFANKFDKTQFLELIISPEYEFYKFAIINMINKTSDIEHLKCLLEKLEGDYSSLNYFLILEKFTSEAGDYIELYRLFEKCISVKDLRKLAINSFKSNNSEITKFLTLELTKKSEELKFDLNFINELNIESFYTYPYHFSDKIKYFLSLDFTEDAIEYFNNLDCWDKVQNLKILYHCFKGNAEIIKSVQYLVFDPIHLECASFAGNFEIVMYILDNPNFDKSYFENAPLRSAIESENEKNILDGIEIIPRTEQIKTLFPELFRLCSISKSLAGTEVPAAASSSAAASSKVSISEHGPKVDFSVMLNFAAKYNMPGAVKWLLEVGANTEKIGRLAETPLILAAKCANHEIVRMLLDKGCNIEATDYNGNNFLELILANSKISELKEFSAEFSKLKSLIDLTKTINGKILSDCVIAKFTKALMAEYCDEGKIDHSYVNPESGDNMVLIAAKIGSGSAVECFAARGVNLDHTNLNNQNILHLASSMDVIMSVYNLLSDEAKFLDMLSCRDKDKVSAFEYLILKLPKSDLETLDEIFEGNKKYTDLKEEVQLEISVKKEDEEAANIVAAEAEAKAEDDASGTPNIHELLGEHPEE